LQTQDMRTLVRIFASADATPANTPPSLAELLRASEAGCRCDRDCSALTCAAPPLLKMTPDGEQKGLDDGGPQQHAQDPWDGIRQGVGALAVEVGLQLGAV
jgi:hypothetical protein